MGRWGDGEMGRGGDKGTRRGGRWVETNYQLSIPNAPCPIPHAQFPMPFGPIPNLFNYELRINCLQFVSQSNNISSDKQRKRGKS